MDEHFIKGHFFFTSFKPYFDILEEKYWKTYSGI